jgi:hypothetical protein
MKQGTIIVATTTTLNSTKKLPEERDPVIHMTKKDIKSNFGMMAPICADKGSVPFN